MKGIHHLGLSVSNLEASRAFFCDLLGCSEVGRVEHYPACFVSNGTVMFTLWQADSDASAFDRRTNVGLHHVALHMESEQELNATFEKLSSADAVQIEFAPEPLRGSATRHFICYEPSGIRVEFIWVPS